MRNIICIFLLLTVSESNSDTESLALTVKNITDGNSTIIATNSTNSTGSSNFPAVTNLTGGANVTTTNATNATASSNFPAATNLTGAIVAVANVTNSTVGANLTSTGVTNVTYVDNATSVTNVTVGGPAVSNLTDVTIASPTYEINQTFPFQVSVLYSYNDEFICGGQIISQNLILTLASCLYYDWGGKMPPIIVTVSAGRTSLNEVLQKTFQVRNVTFHTAYDASTMENNLALIEVKNNFAFSTNINKTDLKKTSTDGVYNVCFVTGWNQNSGNLQAVTVDVVNCGATQPSSRMCSRCKFTNETLCDFTHGSSLVCDGELVGVLSATPSCSSVNQVAVFERLSSAVKWLKENAVSSAVSDVKVSFLSVVAAMAVFLYVSFGFLF